MKIYINGKFHDRADARISVFDHGLLYGDGVFEGLRIYHGRVFKLGEHIERLYRSAKAISLDIPMSIEEMQDAVIETVEVNGKEDGYIRLVVTRGEGRLGVDPSSCRRATVIIIVSDIQLYPEEYYEKGIAIITASSRRMPSDTLDPRIKSLNYLNNILAKIEAEQAGCLEAVMLNREGFVAECTGDNVFIVRDSELLTPDPCHGALDGITRRFVMELAASAGIRASEAAITRYDLYTAEECFLTGTGAEIMPVIRIDGRTIGSGKPGRITRMLTERFRRVISEQHGLTV